jgi:hypothetical protein
MKIRLAIFFTFLAFSLYAKPKPPKLYELRIYHCEPGRLEALLARFRNHTTALFEKHGMENIAYWVPTKEGTQDLYYIVAHKDKAAKDLSWKNFTADEEWKKVSKQSEESGKIIKSIEVVFMHLHPELTKKIKWKNSPEDQLFELRRYYLLPSRYPNIVARFRDHTRKLFEKNGMKNLAYFETHEKEGVQPTLLYFLAHKNAEAAKKSWDDFRASKEWTTVRDASEVSGKIVERVESVYMKPTDFSKIK